MQIDTTRKLLSIGEASEYLGVSIDTLRRWEKKQRILPLRSPGGHRYYSKEDLDGLFGKRYKRDEETFRRTDTELGKTKENINSPSLPDLPTESMADARNEVPGETSVPNPLPQESVNIPQEVIENPAPIPNIHPVESILEPKPIENPPPLVSPISQEFKVEETSTNLPPTTPIPSVSTENPVPIEQKSENKPFEPQNADIKTQKEDIIENPFSPAQVLVPPSETGGQTSISDEEIERRIGSIIKTNDVKKTEAKDIILLTFFSIFLIIDAVLIFIWSTTSRIISPIP